MDALTVLPSMLVFTVLLVLSVSFRHQKNEETKAELHATTTTNGHQIAIVVEPVQLDGTHGSSSVACPSSEGQSFATAISLNELHAKSHAEDAVHASYNMCIEAELDIVSLLPNMQSDTPQLMNGNMNLTEEQESDSENATNMNQTQLRQSEAPIETNDQVVDIKTQFKVACWVVPISAGGIMSVLAGLFENEKSSITHKVMFRAYTFCVYASSISSLSVLGLYFFQAWIQPKVCLASFFMWAALGTVAYALAFATCMMIQMGLAVMVLVLVSPFFPVGIVLVIRIGNL